MIINNLLKFMSSKLAFFADEVMSSINFIKVFLSEEKTDAVELVELGVGAHVEAVADTFRVLLKKKLIDYWRL